MISAAPRLRVPHARDRRGEESRIADSLGPLERRSGVRKRGAHVGREQVEEAAESQDPGGAGVVTRGLRQRFADELARRSVSPERRGEREEDVCALHTGGSLGQELVEQCGRPLSFAGEAVEVRGLQAPLSRQDRIVRCQLGSQLVQLGRCGSRSARSCLFSSILERGGGEGIGAVDG